MVTIPCATFPQSSDLHQAMFSALVGHKAEFVRLLLENGLCFIQFLKHEDTLCDLYNHLPSCLFSHKVAKQAKDSTKITLRHVAIEVRHLLGSFTQPLYPMEGLSYQNRAYPHKIEMPSDNKGFTVSLNETTETYISHYIPHTVPFFSAVNNVIIK